MAVLASVFFFLSLGIDVKAKSCLDIYREITAFALENPLPGEASLRAQGFGDDFVSNLDTVDAFIREAPIFRSRPGEARSTFLADRLEDQMNFAARGLKSRGEKDPSALEGFNLVRQEIRDYPREGLSHRDWVYFNHRLANETSPVSHKLGRVWWDPLYRPSPSYQKIIEGFPQHIMASVPGDLGVISFNRSFLTGVIPFSLLNNRSGKTTSPIRYFYHDAVHFMEIDSYLELLDNLSLEAIARFHRHFLLNTKTLTGKERQMVELIYFTLWHEKPSSFIEFADILNKYPGDPERVEQFVSRINSEMKKFYEDWIDEDFQDVDTNYETPMDFMARLIVESGE